MVTLHEGKQFIIDNSRIATAEEAAKLSEEEGRKETLTYQILAAHNHSGDERGQSAEQSTQRRAKTIHNR